VNALVATLRRFARRVPTPLVAAALGAGFAALVVALRLLGALLPLELGVYDAFLRLARSGEADGRIVLVRIGEAEIGRFGHPLSDALLARALRELVAGEPRAIGVDLYRDRPVLPGAEELERVVLEHPNIVMIEKFGASDSEPVAAPPYVAGTGQVGFSDILLDADGRSRRGLLLGRGGASLSTQLALLALAGEGVLPRWRSDGKAGAPVLYLGDRPLERFRGSDGGYVDADDQGYQILLDYPRGQPRFASHSLARVLAGELPASRVRDRVVLIGTAAPSVRDQHATPFGTVFGLEYHAEVVSELLDAGGRDRAGLRFLPDVWESLLVLLCGVGGALVAVSGRSARRLVPAAAGGLAAIVAGGLGAFVAGWWLPVVPASLAWAGAGAFGIAHVSFAERADRRTVMELFGRFLDREVVDEIWRERHTFLEDGRLRGRRATVTVMMTDLVGYSAVAEELDPERLLEWIDEYLAAMARLVGQHGGVVDDYAGDGVKANFGVPVPRRGEDEIDRDARAAVDCALAMEAEVRRLNRSWVPRGLPEVRVRVGLHTGSVVAGLVGGPAHLKYTSLGDVVNTAARLESHLPDHFWDEGALVRILVSEATRLRLGPAYASEELGKLELKGKREPVLAFRIRSRGGEAS
jgi:adenylate cyclase